MATDLETQLTQQIVMVEEALDLLRTGTLQELEAEMTRVRGRGGRMRVDTGFLRASLRSSTASMPGVNPTFDRDPSGSYTYAPTGIALQKTREVDVYLGFTAKYAAVRERFDMFVEGAAQEWPRIVAEVEEAVAARFSDA